MQDIYCLNFDCIGCFQNTSYIKLNIYVNLRMISKSFYFQQHNISSLCIKINKYQPGIEKLNTLNLNNLTSLKIKCNSFSKRDEYIFNVTINAYNLQKLNMSMKCSDDNVIKFQKFTKLTYLKINYREYNTCMEIDLSNCTNLKYLNLTNVQFGSDAYFEQSTNLRSLIRSCTYRKRGSVVLSNNSKLIYLKLKNIARVNVMNMTQLKTKILEGCQYH